MNQILRRDWLPERATEDGAILPLGSTRRVPQEKNFSESHIINPLLTKLVSVKMAGYWPRSFFASL